MERRSGEGECGHERRQPQRGRDTAPPRRARLRKERRAREDRRREREKTRLHEEVRQPGWNQGHRVEGTRREESGGASEEPGRESQGNRHEKAVRLTGPPALSPRKRSRENEGREPREE